MSKPSIRRLVVLAFNLVLCALVITVFAENRILVGKLRSRERIGIEPSQRVRHLTGNGLDGFVHPIELPPQGQKLLIIAFSTSCPACDANEPGWQSLEASLRGRIDWRVVRVSRDAVDVVRKYCEEHGLPKSDVFADPPYKTYTQLGLAFVPRILVVSPLGRVEKTWTGELSASNWSEVSRYVSAMGQQGNKPR